MTIVLGTNQYGKAENRIVRIYRESPRHEIHDVNVSTALRGDFTRAHTEGDQSAVLPTDTQKQTAYAFAKEKGLQSIEDYGLVLARHFVEDGRVTTAVFRNYHIPQLADVPDTEVYFAATSDALGPYGAKSMSESPYNPVAAALANAITDAIGVRPRELPMSRDRIWRLLHADDPS